jgi:hypothetical protein
MGLAKGTTQGVLKTPRYGSNWELLPLDKLKLQYDKVMNLLTREPHGEYFAIQELFGTSIANMLVKRADIKKR